MADDPSVTHYQLKNSSLCLQISRPPPRYSVQWKLAKDLIVLDKNITPLFLNKVDYFPENQSICIKKLTNRLSGTYTVTFADSNYQSVTETHTVIVQGKFCVVL